MLIVLYGGTGYVGHDSRKYFKEHGFEVIQKINYVPDGHLLKSRYEPRKLASLEEVKQCDFVYEHPDGIVIGFNKEQIIDAVWGRKNCLITLATVNMDFIEQIKSAYGDFATVIGAYIQENSLKKIFTDMENMTEPELAVRMQIGSAIKKNLSEKRHLFDEIVIYDGEDRPFNMSSLYVHYDGIIKKAKEREAAYRDKNYVPLPYTGSEPYVFISYAHKDRDKIKPVLSQLQMERCRIWFDEGIDGGQNWRKMIASKIESADCKNFIIFISENSTASYDVEAEINAALALKKTIIPVEMDDSKFGIDIAMYLHTIHKLKFDENIVKNIIKSVDKSVITSKSEKGE